MRAAILVLSALAAAAARAGPATVEPRTERLREVRVPDEELFDQDGNALRFERDLVRDKVVAVNFVFTSCSTICSPMTAVFARLQSELKARGLSAQLISLSLDPRTDTPERLRQFADRFGRKDGWSFVTGQPERVKRVLKALGGYVADPKTHPPLTLVGNAATGQWRRVYGLVSPETLADAVAEVSAAPARAAAGRDGR